jgi:hypothetical protein
MTAGTVAQTEKRLKDSGKFDDVEVLKRFASIVDLSRISLVIVVNEGAVRLTSSSSAWAGRSEPGVAEQAENLKFVGAARGRPDFFVSRKPESTLNRVGVTALQQSRELLLTRDVSYGYSRAVCIAALLVSPTILGGFNERSEQAWPRQRGREVPHYRP